MTEKWHSFPDWMDVNVQRLNKSEKDETHANVKECSLSSFTEETYKLPNGWLQLYDWGGTNSNKSNDKSNFWRNWNSFLNQRELLIKNQNVQQKLKSSWKWRLNSTSNSPWNKDDLIKFLLGINLL